MNISFIILWFGIADCMKITILLLFFTSLVAWSTKFCNIELSILEKLIFYLELLLTESLDIFFIVASYTPSDQRRKGRIGRRNNNALLRLIIVHFWTHADTQRFKENLINRRFRVFYCSFDFCVVKDKTKNFIDQFIQII